MKLPNIEFISQFFLCLLAQLQNFMTAHFVGKGLGGCTCGVPQ